MKRLLIGSFFLLGLFAIAAAGDYHFKTTLICSDCHVMHKSQQHGYNADGGGIYTPIGNETEPFLLRDEVNKLCLSCHDGSGFFPDVLEDNSITSTREAGALNKTTSSGPYYPKDGHTLYSKATAPGGTWAPDTSEGLACINCHHQHGGGTSNDSLLGQYRNLRSSVGGTSNKWVSYAIGTIDLTKAVFERATSPVGTHYDISNIDFNEPDPTKSAMGAWCQGCHTNFHGSSTDANMRDQGHATGEGWVRHPTADVNIGGLGGAHGHTTLSTFSDHLYRVKVMSPTGDWGTQGTAWASAPTDLTPTCITCHKGHGNKNAFGLIYAEGNRPLGEEGDGDGADYQAKTLCRQCHRQGAYATP